MTKKKTTKEAFKKVSGKAVKINSARTAKKTTGASTQKKKEKTAQQPERPYSPGRVITGCSTMQRRHWRRF